MTDTTIKIPTPLRKYTREKDEVTVSGETAGEVLDNLVENYPELREQIYDDEGNPRRFVNIFVGEDNIRDAEGLDTPVGEDAEVSIVPAIAGGRKVREQLAEAKSEVEEIGPEQLEQWLEENDELRLIDVREPDEVANGKIPGAKHIVRGYLDLKVESKLPDKEKPVVCYCAGGTRSLLSAKTLQDLGYQNVYNLSGGFSQWQSEDREVREPRTLSDSERERYARHLSIPEVGEEGQQKLLNSKVLLVGAGGLGSPAAYYLAAAGVGELNIVDNDEVERSNLQRQILHSDADVGERKTDSARETLEAFNPDIEINTYDERLTSDNIDQILPDHDVVVDGSDNFPTRYLVNDACLKWDVPCVHGSIYRFEGMVSVFCAEDGPDYRDLYPEPTPPELAPSCAEAGVLGVLPGVIGLLQAIETVKLILDIGDPLIGRMLIYDALDADFREVKVERDPDNEYHDYSREDFPEYVDYEHFCEVGAGGNGAEPVESEPEPAGATQ